MAPLQDVNGMACESKSRTLQKLCEQTLQICAAVCLLKLERQPFKECFVGAERRLRMQS